MHHDGCDNCGEIRELYHNERTGLAFCEACDAADADQINVDARAEQMAKGLGVAMAEATRPGINRLEIGYTFDGEGRTFTCDVEEFNDLAHATKALQLHLMEQILAIKPWVNTRERVSFQQRIRETFNQ
jgi:hypothetical protein